MWPFRKRAKKPNKGLATFKDSDHVWLFPDTIRQVIEQHYAFLGKLLAQTGSKRIWEPNEIIKMYYDNRREGYLHEISILRKEDKGGFFNNSYAQIRRQQAYLVMLRSWRDDAVKNSKDCDNESRI